jgi:hypothetical protein
MTPNHFDSDLDELFVPDSESDRFWTLVNATFWGVLLALLVGFWGWAAPYLGDFFEWAFA